MMQSNSSNNNNNNKSKNHRNKETLIALIESLLLDGKLQSWISNVDDLSGLEVNLIFQILHDNQSLGIDSSSIECAARRVDLFTPNQRQLLSSKASSSSSTMTKAITTISSSSSSPTSTSPQSNLWMCLKCSHPNNGNDHCSKCNGSSTCGVTKFAPRPPSMIWIKNEPKPGYRCHTFWIRTTHVRVILGPNGKNHKSLVRASGVESILVNPFHNDDNNEWCPVQVKASLPAFLKLVPMVQKLLETPGPFSPKSKIIWIPNYDVPLLIGPGGQNIKKMKESIPGIQTVYALQDYIDEERMCPVQVLGQTDKCVREACKKLELLHDGVYKDSCMTLPDVIREYNASVAAATPPNTPSSATTTSPDQDWPALTTKKSPRMISKVIWLHLSVRALDKLIGGNCTSPQECRKPIEITFQGEKEEGGAKVHACPKYMDKSSLCPFEIVGTIQEIRKACVLLEKTYGVLYYKADCATLQDVIANWNETNNDDKEISSPAPSDEAASPEIVQSDEASEYDDEIVTDSSSEEEETFHSVPSAPLELVKAVNEEEERTNKMKENVNPAPPVQGFWWSPTPQKPSKPAETPATLSLAPISKPTQTPLGHLLDQSVIPTPPARDTPRSMILPSPVADTPSKQLFVNKDNPLYRFLEEHEACFRCTVDEFMNWLDSEDIQSLQDLSEALEQEDYVEKMKECGSFKKYMKDLFRNDLESVLGQEPPPTDLVCPLSQQLFQDPVLASDGYTYERKWIETWISHHDESPKTSQPLMNNLLIRNIVVHNLAGAWRKEQNVKKEEQEKQED